MSPKAIMQSFAILLVVIIAFTKCNNKPNIAKTIADLRKEEQPKFDSTMKALAVESRFLDSINLLIQNNKLKQANLIVDSLIRTDPKNFHNYVLKGQIYEADAKYDSALYEYNISMSVQTFPTSLEARAKMYIRMKEYDSAIIDYEKAYQMNYDYSLAVAQTFELKKQKDSALKYYKIYLEHDPNSETVKQKILLLQK